MATITDQIEQGSFETGFIARIHGVNGRLLIRLNRHGGELVDCPGWLFIRIDAVLVPYRVTEGSVFQKDSHHLVVGLDRITSPEQAAALVGKTCHLPGSWSDWFEKDQDTTVSLIGYQVTDLLTGLTGSVSGFEDIPGNPLLEIEIAGKKTLLPWNAEYVMECDPLHRHLRIRIPEGLLDL